MVLYPPGNRAVYHRIPDSITLTYCIHLCNTTATIIYYTDIYRPTGQKEGKKMAKLTREQVSSGTKATKTVFSLTLPIIFTMQKKHCQSISRLTKSTFYSVKSCFGQNTRPIKTSMAVHGTRKQADRSRLFVLHTVSSLVACWYRMA